MPNRVIPYFPYALTNYTPVMRPMPVPGIQAYDECPAVCVRISEKLIPYLLGLLEIYRWKDKFEGSEEEVNTALGVIQDLMAALMEACVCCCDPTPTNRKTRYHPDTGKLQYSDDDGLTWTDAPTSDDPRFSSPVMPPPPDLAAEGDDRKCQMAHNATTFYKSLVDDQIAAANAGANLLSLLTALISVIGFILSGGTAPILLMVAVQAIASLGGAAVSAAMTAQVYEDLKCILFCHIPDDGIITEAVWQAVKADINQQFTGVAQTIMWHHFNGVGPVGLQNMCYLSAGTAADCSACVCGCEREFDFTLGLPPYSEIVQGLRVIGEGVKSVPYTTYTDYADVWIKLPEPCTANKTYVTCYSQNGTGNQLGMYWYRKEANGSYTLLASGNYALQTGISTAVETINPASFDAVRIMLNPAQNRPRAIRLVRLSDT